MSPALRDYALVWSTATASRDPRTRWTFALIALTMPLAVGLLAWVRTGALAETIGYAARVLVGIWLFAALTFYVPGAIRLNTPANARLVPRMRRRLVELTVFVWAAVTAAMTLLAWDMPVPAPVIAMASFAWLVGLGLGSAGYQIGTLMQMAVPMAVIARKSVPDVLFEQPVAAGIALLLLALGARTIGLMFPNGGDRHWERRQAQLRVIERASPEGMMRQASRMRLGGALYAAALRRNSTPRRAPALVLPVLGPAMHWTQRYLPLLALTALALAVVALVKAFGSATAFAGGWVIGMCQAMLFAQLFTYEQRSQRLADTRTEQSLLRMAAAIPADARPFNRQLNASLLRMAVLDWAAVAACLVAVSAFAGAPRAALLLQAQICCLTLPLLAANVRNHARSSGSRLLHLVGALLAALALSLGTGALLREVAGTPVMPVAAGAGIVLALAVALWRWRKAVAAPHAFPVGRFA